VAILRALIHQPELLLADEPTGNLDTESSKTVLGLLKKLVKKEGKTLVLVTHSMEIAQMADKVYLIRDGKLITKTM
ncbi:MAG: ABC transporter ATP-binding protein, partial [Thiohalomonadales bacterium]